MERKCADTVGTVPVPWAFPVLKYWYNFQIQYTEAILLNSSPKLLWFEITKMLIAVQEKDLHHLKNHSKIASFIIIFDTLSFPALRRNGSGKCLCPGHKSTRTHTHTRARALARLTALCPRLYPGKPVPERYRDFTEARDTEWQWHQLGRMQVCTSLQTDNHASTPPPSFYRPDALPAAQPTASKHWRQ